jgi:hypothetical protein
MTRHTSRVTRHASRVTRYTSHITRHTSHVTHHTSHVTRHTSHVTRPKQRVPSSRGALLPEKEMHLAAVIATGATHVTAAVAAACAFHRCRLPPTPRPLHLHAPARFISPCARSITPCLGQYCSSTAAGLFDVITQAQRAPLANEAAGADATADAAVAAGGEVLCDAFTSVADAALIALCSAVFCRLDCAGNAMLRRALSAYPSPDTMRCCNLYQTHHGTTTRQSATSHPGLRS